VGRGSERVEPKGLDRNEGRSGACIAHQANCLGKSVRECMKDLHCWTETIYQCPIPIAIFFKGHLSFLKELKDVIGRFGELKCFGEGTLREVDTRFFGIVSQGIND
jgi:hypothetical protein